MFIFSMDSNMNFMSVNIYIILIENIFYNQGDFFVVTIWIVITVICFKTFCISITDMYFVKI
jgi:hypothetical protein